MFAPIYPLSRVVQNRFFFVTEILKTQWVKIYFRYFKHKDIREFGFDYKKTPLFCLYLINILKYHLLLVRKKSTLGVF